MKAPFRAVFDIEWDDGNRAKCQKHGMSLFDIEVILSSSPRIAPDLKHSDQEQRFLAIGKSGTGRPGFVVFTLREGRIRPLSARFMHAKEARKYEKST